MGKRKWLLAVVIVAVSIVVLLFAGIGILLAKGFGCSVGRYLVTESGADMLVVENSPVVMSNRTNRELFDSLTIGDKILVIHDGIAETYPAKTGVYAVFKLGDGSAADIPQTVIDELSELGWLASGTQPEDLYFNSGVADDVVGGFTGCLCPNEQWYLSFCGGQRLL